LLLAQVEVLGVAAVLVVTAHQSRASLLVVAVLRNLRLLLFLEQHTQ
jgi:hypothetical protein